MSVPLIVLLQLTGAQPLPLPDMQPNVNLWGVLAWAALNPAVIAVAWMMGRRADQTSKLGIAAFAGAAAGIALLWVAARLHLSFAVDTGRAGAGVFCTALPFGVLWAWAGRRAQTSSSRNLARTSRDKYTGP